MGKSNTANDHSARMQPTVHAFRACVVQGIEAVWVIMDELQHGTVHSVMSRVRETFPTILRGGDNPEEDLDAMLLQLPPPAPDNAGGPAHGGDVAAAAPAAHQPVRSCSIR